MKVIFGLGNPGSKYFKTRHNVGFLFLDYLNQKFDGGSFVSKSKLKAEISEIFVDGQKVLLVKPQTFMNLSGDCVNLVASFYNLNPTSDICIVFDDIDLKFSDVRFKSKGGAGTHNGMRDIVLKLPTKEFSRLKIGIDGDNRFPDLAAYVLSNFAEDELQSFKSIFDNSLELILDNFLDFSEKKS
jgi:PTH1 family peptidyl-tRNA hydrolase